MPTLEFEGTTLKEALERAKEHSGGNEVFDYRVVSESAAGFFKKGHIKIALIDSQAHLNKEEPKIKRKPRSSSYGKKSNDNPLKFTPKESNLTHQWTDPKQTKTFPELDIKTLSPNELFVFETLKKLLETLDTDGKIQHIHTTDDILQVNIDAKESVNLLIGRKGKNLDALQLVVNKLLTYHFPDEKSPKVILDLMDYRTRREDYLIRLAISTADRVKEHQQAKTLDPLPPAERRIIHLTLESIPGIQTGSIGTGHDKALRISPTT